MSFFDVVLAICLASDPSQCREQRLQYESSGSLNDCLVEAQFYIAAWQEQNPGWVMKNFRCEYAQDAPGNDPS